MDPPYGIGERWGGEMKGKKGSSRLWSAEEAQWDSSPISTEAMAAALHAGKHHIVWGGNYYSLPASKGVVDLGQSTEIQRR
jgi:hypothetical protein